jgi:hypothetical protein
MSYNLNPNELKKNIRLLFDNYDHSDKVYPSTANRINKYIDGSNLSEKTKININNLKLEILAQWERNKIMADSIGNKCLSIKDIDIDIYFKRQIMSVLDFKSKSRDIPRP